MPRLVGVYRVDYLVRSTSCYKVVGEERVEYLFSTRCHKLVYTQLCTLCHWGLQQVCVIGSKNQYFLGHR